MTEGREVPPQPETKTEAEKTAEEELRTAQEILEKLYDPFKENDWLVHYTPDFHTLDSILKKGIWSKMYADTARKLGDNTVPLIKAGLQGESYISTFHKILDNPCYIPLLRVLGRNPEKTGVMFTPIKNAPLLSGPWEHEKQVKFKVAKGRFKMLVTRALVSYHHTERNEAQETIEKLKIPAQINQLPIIDNWSNLLYPVEIPAEALREITIPRLRELAKTLGIEKLRAMSIEEIKSAASALTLPK